VIRSVRADPPGSSSADLIQLSAGVDASSDQVRLEARAVQVEAHLALRRENLAGTVERARTSGGEPENAGLVAEATPPARQAAELPSATAVARPAQPPPQAKASSVGERASPKSSAAPRELLADRVNVLGQTVQRTVDTGGRLVERTLDADGKLVEEKAVADVATLPVLSLGRDAEGRVVRVVKDVSGAAIEILQDPMGRFLSAKILDPAASDQPPPAIPADGAPRL
jgi:hypothetical protein